MSDEDLYNATLPGKPANKQRAPSSSDNFSATTPVFMVSPVVSWAPRVVLPGAGAGTQKSQPTSSNSVGIDGSRYTVSANSSAVTPCVVPQSRINFVTTRDPQAGQSGLDGGLGASTHASLENVPNKFKDDIAPSKAWGTGVGTSLYRQSNASATTTYIGPPSVHQALHRDRPTHPRQMAASSVGTSTSDNEITRSKISASAAEFVPGNSASSTDASGASNGESSKTMMKATSPEFVPSGLPKVDRGKRKDIEPASDEESAEEGFVNTTLPLEVPTRLRNGALGLPLTNGALVRGSEYSSERKQNFRYIHPNRAGIPGSEGYHKYHPETEAELLRKPEVKAHDDPDFQAEIQRILVESPQDWLKRLLARASKEKDRLRVIILVMQGENNKQEKYIRNLLQELQRLELQLQLEQQLQPPPMETRVIFEYENGNSFLDAAMELKADMHKLTKERDEALQETKRIKDKLEAVEKE